MTERDRLYTQLDRIEGKLDVQADRVSAVESAVSGQAEAISWLKKHVSVVTGVVLSVLTAGLIAWYKGSP